MKAFIITLMREPVRRLNAAHVKNFLGSFGYDVEIVEATDARGPQFRHARVAEDALLTAGEIATSQSHLLVHQRIAELGETCLILEDDAWFPQPIPVDWADDIKHVMTCGSYDMTIKGAPQLQYGEHLKHGINTIGMPWGTQAYFVTPEGAGLLIEGASPIQLPVDVLLDTLSRDGKLQGCVAKNCFVGQNDIIHSSVGPR